MAMSRAEISQRSYKKNKEKWKPVRQAYYIENKAQFAETSKEWYSQRDNRIKRRNKKFTINFDEVFKTQNGLCAIGGEPLPENDKDIHPDHDHSCCDGPYSCGKCFRGLTCRPHNVGLGMFGDDWELLEKAAKYVFDAKVRFLNV